MPMTMDVTYFIAWRKRLGLTQVRLTEILGINVRTIKKWESGERRLPPYIGLLMAAIEHGLDPLGAEAMIEVSGASDD